MIQTIWEERTLPNSFYEATIITLLPKSDKGITKKENHRPISLINIDEKILNKILANQIQHYIKKKIMHHDQGGLFSQGCKDGLIFQKSINIGHHINKRTGKKSHNYLNR